MLKKLNSRCPEFKWYLITIFFILSFSHSELAVKEERLGESGNEENSQKFKIDKIEYRLFLHLCKLLETRIKEIYKNNEGTDALDVNKRVSSIRELCINREKLGNFHFFSRKLRKIGFSQKEKMKLLNIKNKQAHNQDIQVMIDKVEELADVDMKVSPKRMKHNNLARRKNMNITKVFSKV